MSIGVIFEGGGLKGLFTAGFIDVILKNNIKIDTAIGVSAGAIFGTNIKSEQIGRVLRFNLRYCQDPRYFSLKSLIKTGDLFGADFCYNQLTYHLDPFDYKKFEKNPMNFYAVTTNVETGKAEYHLCKTGTPKEDIQWIRASASMPIVSRPVQIDNRLYLDGGVADPLPVKFAQDLGLDKLIVVRTKEQGFIREPLRYSWLAKVMYRKYPDFLKKFENQHILYNQEVDYISVLENKGKILCIQPQFSLPASVIERKPKNILATYQMGVNYTQGKLEKIKSFISKAN